LTIVNTLADITKLFGTSSLAVQAINKQGCYALKPLRPPVDLSLTRLLTPP